MIRGVLLLIAISFVLSASHLEDIYKKIETKKLYSSIEWRSLLHYNDSLNIDDPTFILSIDDFSLKNEMLLTIDSFFNSTDGYIDINDHPQCRFPARFLFIKTKLDLSDDLFPSIECKEFQTYTKKAPADEIYVIFASENVKNPSSMMGHSFLKFEGLDSGNELREHSLSFYTTIETLNPFRLLYENTISGMKGIFVLRPYSETKRGYLEDEGRNIWEYKLKLSEYQKRLIVSHMWELKDTHLKYYFTSYNCSTVLFFTLALIDSDIYNDENIWITPIDVTKYLYKYDLIASQKLTATSPWLNRMLHENFNSTNLVLDGASFDISNYKSPIKTPDEKEISLGYKQSDKRGFLKGSFLGASHLLEGDSREYFGQSELKIAYTSLLLNRNKLKLDEFTLYGMKSYLPYQPNARDLSYEFNLGLYRDYNSKMNATTNAKVGFGAGYSFAITQDIDLFMLLNVGVLHNRYDGLKIKTSPKVGFSIYEIFNMKSIATFESVYFGSKKIYDKQSLKQSIFLSKNSKIYIFATHYKAKKSRLDLEIALAFNF